MNATATQLSFVPSIKPVKKGTMRAEILRLIAENGSTSKAELKAKWPTWTDKNFTECLKIMRKTFGYDMQYDKAGDVLTVEFIFPLLGRFVGNGLTFSNILPMV